MAQVGSPSKMQGYMSLKSSAFNPVSGKLSSQHMVVDHMNAHYKKVRSAKSAIDAKPPKASVSSQKVRDRVKRNKLVAAGGVLPNKSPTAADYRRRGEGMGYRSNSLLNMTVGGQYDDPYAPGQHDDEYEMNYLNTALSEQLEMDATAYSKGQGKGQGRGTGNVQGHVLDQMDDGSVMSYRSGRQELYTSKDTTTRKKQSGDILDKRGHKFTEPEAMFTPRILKKDVPSHLSKNSKTYCQGRPKSRTSGGGMRRSQSQQSVRDSSETTNTMLDETIVSRDFSARIQQSGSVPPLDISLDADHMKWLKEQAVTTEKRRRDIAPPGRRSASPALGPGNKTSYQGDTTSVPTATRSFNRTHRGKPGGGTVTLGDGFSDNKGKGKYTTSPPLNMSWTMKKVKDEEDDLKYLNFVSDVTTDVLTRGIFTNRVLRQVFNQHMERQRGVLDENRMKHLIDTLRVDLGIPKDDDYTSPEDVGMGDTRPPMSSTFGTQDFSDEPSLGKSAYSQKYRTLNDTNGDGGDDDVTGGGYRRLPEAGYTADAPLLKTSKQPFDFEFGLRPPLEDLVEESEKTHSSKSRESTRRFPDEDEDEGTSNSYTLGQANDFQNSSHSHDVGGDTTLTEISYLDNTSNTSKDTLTKLKDIDSASNASTTTSTVKGEYAAVLSASEDKDSYSGNVSNTSNTTNGVSREYEGRVTPSQPRLQPRPQPRPRADEKSTSHVSEAIDRKNEESDDGEDAMYSDNFDDDEDGF